MNKGLAILILVLMCFGQSQSIKAGKIEKAYQALSIYDYFKAKHIFEKQLKKDSVASAYGLSLIYGRNDNPFYQLDSAYLYICIADQSFPKLKEKKREKLVPLGLDSLSIANWKDTIDLKAFKKVNKQNNLEAYEYYVAQFEDSDWKSDATYSRDSIIFQQMKMRNSSDAYHEFMQRYPESIFFTQAKNKYEEQKFLEAVAKNSKEAYQAFIKKNPLSPYLSRAQDSVYAKYTVTKTIEEYDTFIKENPENPNTAKAWRNIYRLYTSEYSPSRIVEFQIDYADYPFKDELKVDLRLANKRYLPFAENNKWGFIDESGKIMISPIYDFVDEFSEGLALCSKNGKLGFIDKSESIIIPFEYDEAESFKSGIAIVEKNDFYGVINRANKVILPFKYDFVGGLNANLMLVEENSKYGFANKKGQLIIAPSYEYASDFKNGFAIVEKDNKKGIIDSKAQFVIPMIYSWLELPNQYGVIRAKKDSLFGLIDISGEEILPFSYNQIGSVSSGLLLIRSGTKYGYSNYKGEIVVSLKYDFAQGALLWGEFEKGYAKYMRKEKFGIVDSLGEEVVPAIFENIRSYKDNGLFPVKKRGKWGYSNPSLQLIIPYNFQLAEKFANQLAIVKVDTAYGIINEKGEWGLEPTFNSIEREGENFIVSNSMNFKLLEANLKELLPQTFEKIEKFDEKYFRLTKNGNVFYYSIEKNALVTPQLGS